MRFEFATATRVFFGAGAMSQAGPLAREMGRRTLLVTGRNAARAQPLLAALRDQQITASTFPVGGEPEVRVVEAAVAAAKRDGCDFVISFGGGSVIDAGKAIAAMLANEGELLDYLEVIGRGKSLSRASAPLMAIPTTAGTGSEVTRNAVLASAAHGIKVSLRSHLMLPSIAIVDPQLTCDLPPAITASTGLDALTQLIEPFVSVRANPMTDALCREGIRRVGRSLRRAFADGRDAEAREDMSLASLWGGMALANAGLGAVHGFAGPIGGMFPAPHGQVCAALLPHVMAMNLRAFRQRQPTSEILGRYEEVARLFTANPTATADDGVESVRGLVAALGIPGLAAYGVTWAHVKELVEKAAKASSMKGNPIALAPEELAQILEQAIGLT